MKTRTFLKTLMLGTALVIAAGAAQADTYPSRPLRFVVPFPAGSATDLAARVMANALTAGLGQAIVVDNKPGAGGSIAAMEVVRSTPDGYNLLFSSNSAMASNVALLKNMPYDPRKDLTPVAAVGDNALVLMVRSDHPAKNVKEFLEYARQHKGGLNAGYGSSSSQISIAVLSSLGKIETQAVPYKGIPLAVNDTLGGTVDFTFVDLGNAMAQTKGGKLRPLGITAPKRSALVGNWPALAETLPGFDITAWFAIAGPAGLPKDVVDKLNGAVSQALSQPAVQEKLAGIGIQTTPMAPAELKTFVDKEVGKWVRLAREANVQPE